MMSYELFKTLVEDQIKDYLPQSFAFHEVKIRTVFKTNEKLDCMTLVPAGSDDMVMCPTVYLNERYEEFKYCQDLDQVLREIAWIYINYQTIIPKDFDFGFEGRKDKIIMCVINTEKNEEMLKKLPHRNILDFSVMYRIVMNAGETGLDTVVVTHEMADLLGVTEKELFEAAAANAKDILPMKVFTLREVAEKEMMTSEQQEAYIRNSGEPFVITTELMLQGAGFLAQPEVLKLISKRINDNYYVIPSSINEFLVSPARFTDPCFIRDTLRMGNSSVTSEKEILSDNIYYYDRKEERLRIA